MHVRLDQAVEQRLAYFAQELDTTKSDLVKPYILRMMEDMEDYIHASKALKEEGSVSLDDLEKEFANVED